MKGVNLLNVTYSKESSKSCHLDVYFITSTISNNSNSNIKDGFYGSLSFFCNAVEGPPHCICQFGCKVFILLAGRQIKGIMDRTEPGFC